MEASCSSSTNNLKEKTMRANVHIALIIIALMCLGVALSMAQISSRQSGNWNSSATWSTWDSRTAKNGTITVTNGSAAVTGSGTSFTTELSVNNVLEDPSGNVLGTVLTITDDFNLTLSANATVDYSGSYYTQRIPTSTDDVIISSGDSVALVGSDIVNSLTIQTNAKLAKTTTSTITVTNTFDNCIGGIAIMLLMARDLGRWLVLTVLIPPAILFT